jgi:hypothetical protein
MEGPHGSGGAEPPEVEAFARGFLHGLAWGFGLGLAVIGAIWLVTT